MTREMRDIEHTHPHTDEAFGSNGGVFTRGPAAADGGTPGDEMSDVDHDAPDGDGANDVWERGVERDESAPETPTDGVKPDEAVPVPEEPTDE